MAGSKAQIRTRLSEPPVAKRRFPGGEGVEETREPGVVEGAQEMEFTPRPWAGKILWDMELSLNLGFVSFCEAWFGRTERGVRASLLKIGRGERGVYGMVGTYSSTETFPSLDAQANKHPLSCGDQEMMLTEAVCSAKSKTFVH